MKTLSQKLLALTLVIAFATGCASSVTSPDANTPDQPNTEQVTVDDITDPGFGTDQSMDPIVDEPEE